MKCHNKWEMVNNMYLMLIRRFINDTLDKVIPYSNNANIFLAFIGERYAIPRKAKTWQLMDSFINMWYYGSEGVRQHIMQMMTIANKLSDFKCLLTYNFIIYHVIISLPNKFNVLKTSYNIKSEEWDVNTLILMYSREIKDELFELWNVNLLLWPNHKNGKKCYFKKGKKPFFKQGSDKRMACLIWHIVQSLIFKKMVLKCWLCNGIGYESQIIKHLRLKFKVDSKVSLTL